MPKRILCSPQLPIAELQEVKENLPNPDDHHAEVHLWKVCSFDKPELENMNLSFNVFIYIYKNGVKLKMCYCRTFGRIKENSYS